MIKTTLGERNNRATQKIIFSNTARSVMTCQGNVYLPGGGENGIVCAGGAASNGRQREVMFLPLEPDPGPCRPLNPLERTTSHLFSLSTGSDLFLCKYGGMSQKHGWDERKGEIASFLEISSCFVQFFFDIFLQFQEALRAATRARCRG